MRRILVVCAVVQELQALELPAHIETFVCGVGPIESAIALAAHLAKNSYDLVLNVGIAGGFAPHVDVGSQVIVTAEHYVELGREDGVELVLPEHATICARLQLERPQLTRLDESAIVLGPAITSATITTSHARAASLRLRFPGVVSESMEGFALARAAAQAKIAFMQLRGISNRVGDRASAGWDLQTGFAAAAALAREVIHAAV